MKSCRPTNLAANHAGRLDLCSCGCLHLSLGPVMLRLSPEVLGPLVDLLQWGQQVLPAVQRQQAAADQGGLQG
jgi:hypothetical protein